MVKYIKIWSVQKMRKARIIVKILSMENGLVTGYLTDSTKGSIYYFAIGYSMGEDGRIKLMGLELSREETLRIKEAMFVEIAKLIGNPIFA